MKSADHTKHPECCRRHRAICTTEGDCGEPTDEDMQTVYRIATEAIYSAHPEDYVEFALHAARAFSDSLRDERRAREAAQRSEKKARDIAAAERAHRVATLALATEVLGRLPGFAEKVQAYQTAAHASGDTAGIKKPQTPGHLPEGCTCPAERLRRFREDTNDTDAARTLAGCDTEVHRAAGRAAMRRSEPSQKARERRCRRCTAPQAPGLEMCRPCQDADDGIVVPATEQERGEGW